jgi:hypothetical protein
MMKGAVTLDELEGGPTKGSIQRKKGKKQQQAQPTRKQQQQRRQNQQAQKLQQTKPTDMMLAGPTAAASQQNKLSHVPTPISTPPAQKGPGVGAAPSAPMSANAFFAMIQSTQPVRVQAERETRSVDLHNLFGAPPAAAAPTPRRAANPAQFHASIAEIFGGAHENRLNRQTDS